AALAAEIEDVHADPRGLIGRLTSVIDAAGTLFRFRAAIEDRDGRQVMELLDAGRVDDDGRISALYTFAEPLARAGSRSAPGDELAARTATTPVTPIELAVRRYVAAWTERDPAARRALLEACFAADGRLVGRGRTYRGRAELAALMDQLLADRNGVTIRLTSVIDAAGSAFRIGSEGQFGDGSAAFEALDVGEVDGDGRIAVLHAFAGTLAPAPAT
ncbi:MAG TPA: nuclear transport factor 2 family protein, partial [Kofleriaceae bacterium]|nr:nuclear transport factor 2 family protein [Kofleriaceae bacterium]